MKIFDENFTYEAGGNIATYTNPQGEETKYTYTADGKLRQQENSNGTKQEWSYRLDGRLVKETLSDGSYWENTYNDTERTAARTKKNSSGETLKEERYGFDQRGNIISYTDEKNQTTTRQYDKLNRLIAETGSPATAETAQRKTSIAYGNNTATISNELGEKLLLTKDALGRITSILNQDANNQKLSETIYAYSAEKNTVTETKGEESTTTSIDANNDPVNWTDLAGKLAKGFNTGWNRDATTSNSTTFTIGNYLGAFLADASDLLPPVGIIEAVTGSRFLGYKELSPQQRVTALASAGMSVLPIGIITKAAGGAKLLVGVRVPSSTVADLVKRNDILTNTYRLAIPSTRAEIRALNRLNFDRAAPTIVWQRSAQLFSGVTGKPINAYYNQVTNQIVLGKGSNLGTLTEELIHAGQRLDYGGRIPQNMLPLMEKQAARQLEVLGFEPINP